MFWSLIKAHFGTHIYQFATRSLGVRISNRKLFFKRVLICDIDLTSLGNINVKEISALCRLIAAGARVLMDCMMIGTVHMNESFGKWFTYIIIFFFCFIMKFLIFKLDFFFVINSTTRDDVKNDGVKIIIIIVVVITIIITIIVIIITIIVIISIIIVFI